MASKNSPSTNQKVTEFHECVERMKEDGNIQKKWLVWLQPGAVFLLLLLALQPMLRGHTPWPGDGLLHFYRLAELERAIRFGQLFPRWLPDLGFGYGFPLFNYYAPLSYYISLAPRLAGLSLATSLSFSFALALFVLALAVFLWARIVWKSLLAAVIASLATAYAPYVLYNTYHRAALAEVWGLAFLALTLWATARLLSPNKPKGALVVAVFSYAALILSHNITALTGTPLILSYALFLIWLHRKEEETRGETRRSWSRKGLLILAFAILALGLSAFFWLPALLERDYVQIENLYAPADFAFANNFLKIKELLAWPSTADPSQVNPPLPRSLGWPALILALASWLPGVSLTYGQKAHRLTITLGTVALILMTTAASQVIWTAVPLLNFVQFPWRFLGPVAIGLGMLAGLGAQQLIGLLRRYFDQAKGRNTPNWLLYTLILLISAVILLYALPSLFPSSAPSLPDTITPADTIRFEIETGWLGTTAAADYLPQSVQELPTSESLLPRYQEVTPSNAIDRLKVSDLPDGFKINEERNTPLENTVSYSSDEPAVAVFDRFAFPGWRVRLDGKAIQTQVTNPHGLIAINLPAGNHTVEVTFGNTPLQQLATIISVIALTIFLALIIRTVVPRTAISGSPERPERPLAVILAIVGLVLLLVLLKSVYLDQADTIFRRQGFDGQQIQGLANPIQVNFGDELLLLGYEMPSQLVPADQTADISLFWQALLPVEQEYSVSLQLVDGNGHRVGQDDSFHPAGLPVTRWQDGQYARDFHQIEILPGTPPGEYQLVVYAYETAANQRLETVNQDGLPTGQDYELGTIAISQPNHHPDPSEMATGTALTGVGVSPILAQDVQLLGFDLAPTMVETGGALPLTLYWFTPSTPAGNAEVALYLACDQQGVVTRTQLPQHLSPGIDWQSGQILRAEQILPIPAIGTDGQPLTEDDCTLMLDFQGWQEEDSVQVPLSPVTLNAPVHNFSEPKMEHSVGANLGGVATLAGYNLDESHIRPGEVLEFDLYWRSEETAQVSYSIFAQLLRPDNRILVQKDQLPVMGDRPTSGWVPGEYIRDPYQLMIPLDAAPGKYRLIVGMYDSQTGERLRILGGTQDAIVLSESILIRPNDN